MLRELVALEPRKPILREYEDGPLPEGHVRVMVEFGAPKHGTELTLYRRELPFSKIRYDNEYQMFFEDESVKSKPFFMKLGNMWVGKIIEIGPGLEGYELGQRVTGYGSLRSTHTVKPHNLLKISETMPWKQAVCYDPAQFALAGVRDGQIRLGDAVAVFGLGAIGLMAAQMVKLAGASFVAVIDPIENRRKVALKYGADLAVDPTREDAGLALKKATGKRGVDVAIETSGAYAGLQQAIRGLAYGGNVSMVGWYKECKGGLNLGTEAHHNVPNLIFSRACSEPNRDYPRWSFDRIMQTCWDMLCKGLIQCEDIIDPVVSFEESPAAYQDIDYHPEKSIKLGIRF